MAHRPSLSRRERQIMDALYRLQRASVSQILEELPARRHYSTVRAQLRVLEEKGHVRHTEQGLQYVYSPVIPRNVARRSALRHLVDTFFEGSAESVVAALMGGEATRLSPQEIESIAQIVEESRKGKQK